MLPTEQVTCSSRHQLALLLRAGALAAPIDIVEERTIGPSLGQDNIDQGFTSVMVGMALVLVFMCLSGLCLRWPRHARNWRAWLQLHWRRKGRRFLWELHTVTGWPIPTNRPDHSW